MTVLTSQKQIQEASTADLVETYNALTNKNIKKFASRAAGETQVANAILAAEDRAGHAGVAKGENPVAKPLAEEAPKPAKGEKIAKAIAKVDPAAPAKLSKKAKAEEAAAAPKPAGRKATYEFVRLTAPDTLRRPQPDSMRTKVLNALQTLDAKMKADKVPPAKRVISIADLSKHVEFNARSFIHKLAFQGWCEVAGA
jgi:hypothetical protein